MKRTVIKSTLEAPVRDRSIKTGGQVACCHKVITAFLILTDIADFISDWLFYADVRIVKKGLVYGPPSDAVVYSLLAFSIVGTLTFICEMINVWYETCRNNAWVDSDLLSAVVVWIEDIPQIIISLSIALCREEPISFFQLLKASVILVGVMIRIIISSVKYCNKTAVRSHHHVKYKIAIMLGIILEAICAVAIFFLTQTERAGQGGVSFRVPDTVIEDKFHDQRYFANVSVFIHHAEIFDTGNLDQDRSDKVVNWVRLVSINKIRDSKVDFVAFQIRYQNDISELKFAIWEKRGIGTNLEKYNFNNCYQILKINQTFIEKSENECLKSNFFSNESFVFMKFEFVRPGMFFKKQVLGDIRFNMKVKKGKSGKCKELKNYTDKLDKIDSSEIPVTIRYFKTNAGIDPQETKHLLHDRNEIRFFRNTEKDLTDIRKVWKTGWLECDSTGSFSPNFDRGLKIECDNNL